MARFADEPGFAYSGDELAPFEHERYIHLPGQTQDRLNARYGDWGKQLIRDHPETCLAILRRGGAGMVSVTARRRGLEPDPGRRTPQRPDLGVPALRERAGRIRRERPSHRFRQL